MPSRRSPRFYFDDLLTHEYFGVDIEIAWRIIQKDLPILEKQIQEIYNDIPDKD